MTYWRDVLGLAVDWAACFAALMVTLAVLYLAARLVFYAWLTTKQHFINKQ